jgi:WD40 repeat protein
MAYLRFLFLIVSVGSYSAAFTQIPELILQKGHTQKINSIHYNADGRQIITTANDGITKIWDAYSLKLLDELGGNGIINRDAAITADGKYIITQPAEFDGGYAAIWNKKTHALFYAPPDSSNALILSPHAKYALYFPDKITRSPLSTSKSILNSPIFIYHTETGKLFKTIDQMVDSSTHFSSQQAFLSDSTLLIISSQYKDFHKAFKTIYKVYDFITDRLLHSFSDTGADYRTGRMVLSPSRNFFIQTDFSEGNTAPGDTTHAWIWDIGRGQKIWSRPSRMANAVFSQNETNVLLQENIKMNDDTLTKQLTLLSLKAPIEETKWEELFQGALLIGNSTVGEKLAVVNSSMQVREEVLKNAKAHWYIKIRNGSGTTISSATPKQAVTALELSRDGNQLLTGYNDGSFSIWNITGTEAVEIANSDNIVDPIQFIKQDPASGKMLYGTGTTYGFWKEAGLFKPSFMSTQHQTISAIAGLRSNKYSILGFAQNNNGINNFFIVQNDTPSLVSKFSLEESGSIYSLHWEKDSINVSSPVIWKKALLKSRLSAFSLLSNYLSYDNPITHAFHSDIFFAYGVLQSGGRSDTALLLPAPPQAVYSKSLNGTVFFSDALYYIPQKSNWKVQLLNRKLPVRQLYPSVISDNGKYLIGPDAFPVDSITGAYYYCEFIRGGLAFKTPINFQSYSLPNLNQMIVSPNGATACLLSDPSSSGGFMVRVLEMRSGKPLYQLKMKERASILGVSYSADSRYLYTWSLSGTCSKWDLSSGLEIYTILFFTDHDYAIVLPSGYYYISSRTDARFMNFRLNDHLYNFSQFDLRFNRPDIILQTLGSKDKLMIADYHNAWLDRIQKSGFTEAGLLANGLLVPEIVLLEEGLPAYTTTQSMQLRFRVTDSLFNIKSYNIFINDVPLNGINGRLLPNAGHNTSITQTVLLNEGLNRIEINATNENGIESRKESWYVRYNPPQPIQSRTYFIGIGINEYSAHSSFVDLSYCVKDIRDLTHAFKEKYKTDFEADTLLNADASRENIMALREKLLHTKVDDKVIVSFSGHGMVDPQHPGDFYFVTGNTDLNNPAVNGIAYMELEALLDSIPARKKLLLLDACHSGEAIDSLTHSTGRIPGTQKGKLISDRANAGSVEILDIVENKLPAPAGALDIFSLMKEAFVDIRRNNGCYVLSAAQSNEAAGEGGGISNGWFSSCLLSLLKEQPNITVNELSKKVNQCVNEKSAGSQHTENRQELAAFDWQLW